MNASKESEAAMVLTISFTVCLVLTGVLCFLIGIFTTVSPRCACWTFLIFFQIGTIIMMCGGFCDKDTPLAMTGLSLAAVTAVSMLLLTFGTE